MTHVIEGKTEMMKRGRRCKQLLDDLKKNNEK
jgi:hypothetical protein